MPPADGGIDAATSSTSASVFNPETATAFDERCHVDMERRSPGILVVVAGADPGLVGTALTTFLAQDRGDVDELHVFVSVLAGDYFRTALLRSADGIEPLTALFHKLAINRGDILFGNRTIHALGLPAEPSLPGPAADDALQVLRRLCSGNNRVSIVALPDAGALAVVAHAALQLVGHAHDRFFYLEMDAARAGRSPVAGRGRRSGSGRRPPASRAMLLSEVPTVLADRPLQPNDSFQQLATSRRLARQRLSEPGTLILDSKRRTVHIDDTEVKLPRLQFFWLFTLASIAPSAFPLRALSGNFQIDAHGRVVVAASHHERSSLEAITATARKIFITLFPESAEDFPEVFKRACGPSPGLPSSVAKINAQFKEVLGLGAKPYLIAGGRSMDGYRLTLPVTSIKTEPTAATQARH